MSTLDCADIVNSHVAGLAKQFHCYQDGERLWVVSPYVYPDQDMIEIAVQPVSGGEAVVTDFGETLRHLADLGFDPRSTKHGEFLLSEITKQYQVRFERAMLFKRVPLKDIGSAMQDVLQACLATGHLVYLGRGYQPATFEDEVHHFLLNQDFKVDMNHMERGKSGKAFKIHFYIRGVVQAGLLQTLSTVTPAGMTQQVNAAFRMWHEVPNSRWRATLLDDRSLSWKSEDVSSLQTVSSVYTWTERDARLAREMHAALNEGEQPSRTPGSLFSPS